MSMSTGPRYVWTFLFPRSVVTGVNGRELGATPVYLP